MRRILIKLGYSFPPYSSFILPIPLCFKTIFINSTISNFRECQVIRLPLDIHPVQSPLTKLTKPTPDQRHPELSRPAHLGLFRLKIAIATVRRPRRQSQIGFVQIRPQAPRHPNKFDLWGLHDLVQFTQQHDLDTVLYSTFDLISLYWSPLLGSRKFCLPTLSVPASLEVGSCCHISLDCLRYVFVHSSRTVQAFLFPPYKSCLLVLRFQPTCFSKSSWHHCHDALVCGTSFATVR